MRWTRRKLGDVITLQRGHDLPEAQRRDGGIPIISSSGHTGMHDAAKAKGPGVVTGRYGTLGEVYYVDGDYWPLNTALYVVDFKGNDPRFISYFLKQVLTSLQSDKAAVPGVNRNVVHALDVSVPDGGTQKRIAGILSAYDDLIENNYRRMTLLEDAARELYQEWFVRLRFPGRENTRIVDGVPAGWSRRQLDDLASLIKRGITPRYDDDGQSMVINQKCIRGGRLDLTLARRQSKEFKVERGVYAGDVLVNSTGEGTLGRVAPVVSTIPTCTVDTHVTIVRPKPEISRAYFALSIMTMESTFATMGRGATNQTELSPTQIGAVSVLDPGPVLRRQFDEYVVPLLGQREVLNEISEKARQARDLLLPRLMSGEVAA